MSKKRHSESGSLISLCGCLHAACIIHADQGFSLHPHILNAFAPLWPLCGRGRFKAPGGTEVTSLKQLLVKINGCIFKNPLIWPNHIWGSFKFLKENWLSKTRAVKNILFKQRKTFRFCFLLSISCSNKLVSWLKNCCTTLKYTTRQCLSVYTNIFSCKKTQEVLYIYIYI